MMQSPCGPNGFPIRAVDLYGLLPKTGGERVARLPHLAVQSV
jgi:hypothetical protein